MVPLLVKIAFTLMAVGAISLLIAVAVDLITDLEWSRIISRFVYGGFGVLLVGGALLTVQGLFEVWSK